MSVTNTGSANIQKLSELILLAVKKNALRRTVLSKPHDKTIQKAVLTLATIGGKPALQAEYFHRDNKATHKNFRLNEETPTALCELIGEFSQVNLLCVGGECEFRASSSGKTVILGGDKLFKYLSSLSDAQNDSLVRAGKKEKSYILDGSEPFLRALGVSDENGRVYDRRQAKFRQINRFLELIRDVEDKLPAHALRICDLCCGKSYLSFAVYHYFSNVKKMSVSMTGIDLKPDVIDYCAKLAAEL